MTLRKEKRESMKDRINSRLKLVDSKDNVVVDVYHSLLSALDLHSVDSSDDYRQYLLESLQPNILFHEQVVLSERILFYVMLMDFLRCTGRKVKLTASKPLPIHVAEVLYLSENQKKKTLNSSWHSWEMQGTYLTK